MTHIIESARSGRSKCRGCKRAIAKGEPRFGERLPNPFAEDSDMTLWFHLICAAYRRPESLGEIIDEATPRPDDLDRLKALIDFGTRHRRVERICGAERAPSGRAQCRSCGEAVARGGWRIGLEFFEEGMFNPAGFVHPACASEYFGTTDLVDRIVHFSPDLGEEDVAGLARELA